MTVQELRNHLKESVEIKEKTFEHFNLKLSNIGFSSFDDDGWFNVILEVESLNEESLQSSVYLKANFYDSDNNILATGSTLITEDFSGFDTFSLVMQEDNLAFDINKIILYVGV